MCGEQRGEHGEMGAQIRTETGSKHAPLTLYARRSLLGKDTAVSSLYRNVLLSTPILTPILVDALVL